MSCLKDFEVLVVRARVAAGTSWDGEDGGNKTPSQEPEVRNILRDCANAIERLARRSEARAARMVTAELQRSESPMSGRPPTHILKVMQREGKGRIGVGWLNDDGSMSISLDPCVVLSWKDDVMINAFPVDFKEKV